MWITFSIRIYLNNRECHSQIGENIILHTHTRAHTHTHPHPQTATPEPKAHKVLPVFVFSLVY